MRSRGALRRYLLAAVLVVGALFTVPVLAQEPTPTPAPPALPAVGDLKVTIRVEIVRPDGSFIRPEERDWTLEVTWTSPAGFDGSYEVYRLPGAAGGSPTLVASISAPPAGGTMSHREAIAWPLPTTCFEVRAVVGSERGSAAQACSVTPPSSGPGQTVTPTPIAPPTGQGQVEAPGGKGATRTALLVLGAAALVLSAVPLLRRR
jgi:hypothetical protein